METLKLYTLAESHGITVERLPLPENKSVSMCHNSRQFVALDRGISGADERVCLAHELGHCETNSFYNIYSPFDIREKHERRANLWAINRLVPEKQYKSALRQGYDNIYSLAEYFGVTVSFMKKAVDFYTQQFSAKNA